MTDSTLAVTSDLVDVVAGVLAELGPMTEEKLVSVLAERGVVLGDDDVEDLLTEVLDDEDDLVTVLADERWASLPAMLTGRMFTHRLTGPEVEHDFLDAGPDLDALNALIGHERYQRLVPEGSPVVEVLLPFDSGLLAERGIPLDVVGDNGALLLAPGYLGAKGLAEGDVIALRIADDGLVLEAVADEAAMLQRANTVGDQLSTALDFGDGEPVSLDTVVWTACADDPELFAEPLPPLGEVLDTSGLAYEDELLIPRGFDLQRWRTNGRRAEIARRNDLDDDEAFAVLAVVMLYEKVAELQGAAALAEFITAPDSRTAVEAALPALAEPVIAEAVLAETIAAGSDGAAALGLFAESLESFAPRGAQPALKWLRGKAHERLADVTQAEADYQAAESLDPDWPLALVDLARYASDRGDAARGLALLRRADVPLDDFLAGLLERFQVEPRHDIGRNDPCWCGSGRKYKKCHLHREELPLEERAAWLYQKAAIFMAQGPFGTEVFTVASVRSQHSDDRLALINAMERDPLVTDAILFEGGVFAEFVQTRGALLPDDERLLAGQWQLIERSVYEVEQVRSGEGCTVRDLRTGDVHVVQERSGSRQLKAGALICARVVPAGTTMQIFGGIEPVELQERDELMALLDAKPDPVDLVSFLSRRFAPPALHNTEGEPLMLCEIILRTDDPAALTAELDRTYKRDGDNPEWLEVTGADDLEPIRATLRLDEHELTVQTNSEARADRVLDTVRALDPTLTVVNETRQSALEFAARERSVPAPVTPEVAATLNQYIRAYEQKWLDEPIPALAGHTPRQAAADPTRRGDLIRLLNSFPADPGNPGVMNPDRLRNALGLR
ncbi:tetratricopeptide (TPR) repeat protein [Kibdelosporangium banguiense]|uniref:Tetratricopeptide (TPR) repeat protein n=1 Tax=Kibdelosporangium banguiense TaxID=1365924 RepID=A0ABS4TJG6_9PSEU|nr:SEC-C metal-binding domain-containing protein [Kibdelosporangium banguiense]MBP2324573.1 tetratricopeptide (TPR) repeat protein [Kibdelosporangium banguiense]